MSHLNNLNILLNNLTMYSSKYDSEKQFDLEIIKQRYNFYKSQLIQPMRNQHYINCIWSNDQCYQVTSKDFCSCYYIKRFPKQLCCEIVDKFGFEYMMKC